MQKTKYINLCRKQNIKTYVENKIYKLMQKTKYINLCRKNIKTYVEKIYIYKNLFRKNNIH